MQKAWKYLMGNFSLVALSLFWLFALLNPLFKKYDYGAGFPLVLVFAVLVLMFAVFEFKKKRERNWLELGLLLIFGIFVVISFVFSQTKNVGYPEVLAFLSVSSFYLIFASQEIKWMNKFLKVVLLGGLVACLLGLWLYIFDDQTRMIGPFFNTWYHANEWPNGFALFLLMVWPLGFVFLKGKSWRWILPFIGFVLGCLLLTYSRGAAIAAVGQIVLLAGYFIWRFKLKWLAYIAMVVAICLGVFVGSNYLRSLSHPVIDVEERIAFENNDELTSKQERVDFWKGAIELIKEKPLLGWGPFSFRHGYNGIQKTFLGASDHPHNIFLKIGMENGLIALGAFGLFLLVWFGRGLIRFKGLSKEKRDLAYLLTVSIAGAIAHNLIDYNFNFFANLLLLFVLLAFVRSIVVKKLEVRFPITETLLAGVIAVFAVYDGGILVLARGFDQPVIGLGHYERNYYLEQAEEALEENRFEDALDYLVLQKDLNPLDAKASYLEGAVSCDRENVMRAVEACREAFKEALELDPMNDFVYYYDYLRVLYELRQQDEVDAILKDLVPIMELYFLYVRDNVHFTAFTHNMQAWSDLIDLLARYDGLWITGMSNSEWIQQRDEMLEYAESQHGSSFFMVE